MLSEVENTLDIDITAEQYARVLNRRETCEKIQDIVPHLAPEIREFLISGIVGVEWDSTFKDEDTEQTNPGVKDIHTGQTRV